MFGQIAAIVAAVCAIVIPMHFVTARSDIWVATATAIAFCLFVVARDPKTSRVRFTSFSCGVLALSAIDGHPYGSAFALMFCLLHVPMVWRMLTRRAQVREGKVVTGFFAGILTYSLVWVIYHILLPDINPATLPDLIKATMEIEAGYGKNIEGTGLTTGNLIKFLQLFLYANPFVFASSILGLLVVLRSGGVLVKQSLFIAFGAGIVILLLLAHFTRHYITFWLPFMCLWTGFGLARLFPIPGKPGNTGRNAISLGTLYLLLALVLLSTIQLADTAGLHRDDYEHAWIMNDIGQEIDKMLPQEDIVIAGTPEIALGMLWRLNFGGFCGFTHSDPAYWPLDQPQAVIATPGWDKGCHLLADWLTEHDFQPARCFTGHDLGEGVTILYLSPELMTQEAAVDCTPAQLALLEDTT